MAKAKAKAKAKAQKQRKRVQHKVRAVKRRQKRVAANTTNPSDGGLGRRLVKAILATGMTEESIATAVDVRISAIYRWKGGAFAPRARHAAHLERLLHERQASVAGLPPPH